MPPVMRLQPGARYPSALALSDPWNRTAWAAEKGRA